MDIEKHKNLWWLKPLRANPGKRNNNQYGQFHKPVGNITHDCRQLKHKIKFLIQREKLNKFIKDGQQGNLRQYYEVEIMKGRMAIEIAIHSPRRPMISMIFEDPTTIGNTRSSRKAYTQEVMHIIGEAP